MLDIKTLIAATFKDWFKTDANPDMELPNGKIIKRFELITRDESKMYYIIDKYEKIVYNYHIGSETQNVCNIFEHHKFKYNKFHFVFMYKEKVILDQYFNIVNHWIVLADQEERMKWAKKSKKLNQGKVEEADIKLYMGKNLYAHLLNMKFCSMEDAKAFIRLRFEFDVMDKVTEEFVSKLITSQTCIMDDHELIERTKAVIEQNRKIKYKIKEEKKNK